MLIHIQARISPSLVSISRLSTLFLLSSFFCILPISFADEAGDNKKASLHSTTQLSSLFIDPNLQQCIEQIATASHWTQAEQISGRIDCKKQHISNLSGIEALVNITSLDISINQISDISPLSTLQRLEILKLSFNTIAELRPLMTLKQLKILNIDNNMLTDITALANLYQLRNLSLRNNLISDIHALKGLTALRHLNLAVNNITDITALANLSNMEYLSLLNNDVTDISILENLSNLQGLHLGGNHIDHVASIAGLMKLSNLNLSDNGLDSRHSTEVAALATVPSLQHIDLSANKQLSCTALSHLVSELNTVNTIVVPAITQPGDTCNNP